MRKVVPRLCFLKEQIPSSPVICTQIVCMCVAESSVGRGNLLPGLVPSTLSVSIDRDLSCPTKLRSNPQMEEMLYRNRSQCLCLHYRDRKAWDTPKSRDQISLLTPHSDTADLPSSYWTLALCWPKVLKHVLDNHFSVSFSQISMKDSSYSNRKYFYYSFRNNFFKKNYVKLRFGKNLVFYILKH